MSIDFGKYRDAEPLVGNFSSCFYCGAGVPGGYFNDRGEEFCFPCFCRDEERRIDEEYERERYDGNPDDWDDE